VRRFHQSMCAHRFFQVVPGTMLRNVLQSKLTSPYSSSLSTFGRSPLRTDCGLTNGAFAYRWWPCTMAFHILELYKLMPLLYVAQTGKHCTNFSRLVFNKRKWRRRLQGTDTALQIRKPPKRVDVHIGKGRRARLTRSMRTRTK
jgi:hypothetical protein